MNIVVITLRKLNAAMLRIYTKKSKEELEILAAACPCKYHLPAAVG